MSQNAGHAQLEPYIWKESGLLAEVQFRATCAMTGQLSAASHRILGNTEALPGDAATRLLSDELCGPAYPCTYPCKRSRAPSAQTVGFASPECVALAKVAKQVQKQEIPKWFCRETKPLALSVTAEQSVPEKQTCLRQSRVLTCTLLSSALMAPFHTCQMTYMMTIDSHQALLVFMQSFPSLSAMSLYPRCQQGIFSSMLGKACSHSQP